MSQEIGGASVRFDGDARGLGVATGQAMGYLQQLERAVATNWWGIRNLGLGFAALPAAVVGGVAAAVNAARKWEDAMADVAKTTFEASKSTEENTAAVKELERELLAIARIKPIASVEVAGIAEAAGALGVAQEDIAAFTSVVADLAATTDLTTDMASTALGRLAGLTNVPSSGYENLASAILEVGRSTAATETDIVSLNQRLANLSGLFNITFADINAWSGAIRSAGINAELGGTNLQKAFLQVQKAVSENGKQLEIWADLAGMTSEQFARTFKEDASGAMVSVIDGLAKFIASGGDAVAVLNDLGITEQRLIRLLTTLATAQNTTTNESLKLTNVMKISNDAFREGNTLSEVAERRYQTFGAQVAILKNNFFEMANEVGKALLPLLKATVQVATSIVTGFRAMPPAIKFVIAVLIGLTTAIFGLIAVALLVVPRIVLAVSAVRQFGAALDEARTASAANAAVVASNISALDAAAAAMIRLAEATAIEAEAQRQAMAAMSAANVARAQQAESEIALAAVRAKLGAQEAAYTKTELALAEARIAMAAAEAEAKFLRSQGLAGGAQVLQAAQERLTKAEIDHAVQARILSKVLDELAAAQSRANTMSGAAAALERDAAAATAAHTLAREQSAAAANAANAANGGLIVSGGKVGKAGEEAAEGATKAGKSIATMSRVASGAARFLGLAAIAMTAFTIVSGVLGNRTRKAEEEARKLEEAQSDLVGAFVDGGEEGKKAVDNWIKQGIAQKELMTTAKRLGVTYQELYSIISGAASADEYEAFIEKVDEGNRKGISGAKSFGAEVRILNRQMANSKDVALSQGASYEELADATNNASDAARELALAQIGAEEAGRRLKASTGIIDAYYAQRQAAYEVIDAERALKDARGESENSADELERAELALTRARITSSRSGEQIARAERNLATARIRQQESLERATIRLGDSQESYLLSVEKVEEAEKALNDARNPEGTEALRDAVIGLAEAEKSLRDAQQKSADAQWYLNYLREEGAGARDITIAQNEIADAALDVAKATEAQAEAEGDLAKLTDPAERANTIAKAERELEAARREQQSAALDVAEAERELDDARYESANNILVKDAENELVDARINSRSAAIDARQAERDLAEARRDASDEAVLRAELEYEQVLWRQAQALADTEKNLRELNGETVTGADEAHMLGRALEGILKNVPDGPAKDRLAAFVDILKNAPEAPDPMDFEGFDPLSQISGFGSTDPLEEYRKEAVKPSLWEAFKDNLGRIFSDIGGLVGGALIGKAIAAATTGALAGGSLGSFATPIGTAIGVVGGALIGILISLILRPLFSWLGENIPKAFSAIADFVSELPDKMKQAGSAIVSGLREGLRRLPGAVKEGVGRGTDMIFTFFKELPGRIGYLAGWLVGFIGRSLAMLLEKVPEFLDDLWDFAWSIPGTIRSGVEAALGTLWEFFKSIPGIIYFLLFELPDKMRDIFFEAIAAVVVNLPRWWESAKKWFKDLPGNIVEALGSLLELLEDSAEDLIEGFINGLNDSWPEGAQWLKDLRFRIITAIGSLKTLLKDKAEELIGGFVFGIADKWIELKRWFEDLPETIKDFFVGAKDWLFDIGRDVFQGFIDGMKSLYDKLPEPIKNAAETVVGGLKDLFKTSSPSKVTRQIGEWVGKGLQIGLESSMKEAARSFLISAKQLDPEVIKKQYEGFGIDSTDIAAFTRPDPPSPPSSGFSPPPVAPAAGGDEQDRPVEVHEHLHLEAITAANPSEIFQEFGWHTSTRVRTRGSRKR